MGADCSKVKAVQQPPVRAAPHLVYNYDESALKNSELTIVNEAASPSLETTQQRDRSMLSD